MSDLQNITPNQIGVYITSESADPDPSIKKGKNSSHDKYEFENEHEIVDFLKENMTEDDFFIIYTYENKFGENVLKLLLYGSIEDLAEL